MSEVKEFLEKLKRARNFREVIEELEKEGKVYRPEGLAHKVVKLRKEKERERKEVGMKTSQLRKLFAEVICIEREARKAEKAKGEGWRNRLEMLQPLLTYSFSRGLINKEIYEFFRDMLNPKLYKTPEDVKKMADFFRAIVAYAKFEEKIKAGGAE